MKPNPFAIMAEQFDLLSGMGAFLGFSSELVFEESDNGLLASLQV